MSLHENPFLVLGASPRDSRHRLQELAEEASDSGAADRAEEAIRQLVVPRRRLHAELRWFPGVSPARARAILTALTAGVAAEDHVSGLPALAQINALRVQLAHWNSITYDESSPLTAQERRDTTARIIELMVEIGNLVDSVTADDCLRLINEDRAVAGVPVVSDRAVLAQELAEWQKEVAAELVDHLQDSPSSSDPTGILDLVELATEYGEEHGPLLCHEVIDTIEIHWAGDMAARATQVDYELEVLRSLAARQLSEDKVIAQIAVLESALVDWDALAQPFQLSAAARGREHPHSAEVATKVRDTAVHLANTRGFLVAAERMTSFLQKVMVELRGTAAQLERDTEAIADLQGEREERRQAEEQWAKSIVFQGEIGFLPKSRVSVSADGVRRDKLLIPLDQVERVRWGATRHSLNGIPTGTTYCVFVGSAREHIAIETRNEDFWRGMVNALSRAVMWRLALRFIKRLKAGTHIRAGDIELDDDGAWFEIWKFFGPNERRHLPWHKLRYYSENGSLVVSAVGAESLTAMSSYQESDNTHVVEFLLDRLKKSPAASLIEAIES